VFSAAEVLAKHDENYMAPEAAEAVEKARQAHERAVKSMAQSGAASK
jgi:cytochrome c-type biogenesis protein CcmE